jgi:hypothetical protein
MLVTAMLLCTVIGIGLVSYLQLSRTSLQMANRTFLEVDAANLAEAGLEEALYSFTQLNAGIATATAWTGWTLSGVNATRTLTFSRDNNTIGAVKIFAAAYDISLTTPYIISQATVTPFDGSAPITKVRRMDLQALKSPGAAIVGLSGLTVSGGSTVDSFVSGSTTSSPGVAYSSAAARTKDCVIVPAGSVSLGASGQINGDLKLGATVTPPSASHVSGNITKDYTGTWSLPALPAWASLMSSRVYFSSLPSTLPVSGHSAAADGVYYYVLLGGSISATTITAGKKVVILGVLGSTLQPGLVVGSGAYCLIYLDGKINCAGNGAITNNSWAGALQIFSWTSSPCDLGNSGQTMACVMAPFAPILFTGGVSTGNFVGSVIGKTVTVNGHMDFHYDESLGTLGSIGSIGSIGTAGTTATSALAGITRTKWSEVKSATDLSALSTLTGNFLP